MTADLHVCHLIHTLRHGGAEHLLVTLAEVAAGAGIRLTICSLVPHMGPGHLEELRDLGVDVRTLGLRTRWDLRALPRATALMREIRPQVVHTHLKHADLVGAYAATRLRLPLVSTLHTIEDAPTRMGQFKRRAAATSRLARADHTIAVSEATRAWYLASFNADPAQVSVIPNGVSAPPALGEQVRNEVRASLDISPTTVVAVMLALFRPGKGHEQLLAAARLIPADIDIRFVLAGDGPLLAPLQRAAASDPVLAARVSFPGFQSDIPRLLAGSDLLVHPTLADALPTALIYALAAGVPIVASDVGGVPEIVTPETGVLVPPADAHALAAAITGLARDPHQRRRFGDAGRRRFDENFDARHWAVRLRDLYQQVASDRGATATRHKLRAEPR